MARRSEFAVLNMRVTPAAKHMLDDLSAHMGVSKTAVFETLMRKAVREEGLASPSEPTIASEELLGLNSAHRIDWTKVRNPSNEEFSAVLKEIEALGPMSKSGVPDEELTSEAIYRDHA